MKYRVFGLAGTGCLWCVLRRMAVDADSGHYNEVTSGQLNAFLHEEEDTVQRTFTTWTNVVVVINEAKSIKLCF